MKNIILLLTIVTFFTFFHNDSYAQCADAPDELFRGRLKAPGGVYGNPYTMFDRRKPNNKYFDAVGELGRIRQRIIQEKINVALNGRALTKPTKKWRALNFALIICLYLN